MINSERSQALILFGEGLEAAPDLTRAYEAVYMAQEANHTVQVDRLVLPTDRPIAVPVQGGGNIMSEVSTAATRRELAAVELERYTLPDLMLSERELVTAGLFRQLRAPSAEDKLSAAAAVLHSAGGIAVLSGTQQGIFAATRYYEDLRNFSAQLQ